MAEERLPLKIVHAEKVGFGYNSKMWEKGYTFLQGGMVPELFKWGKDESKLLFEELKQDRSHLFALMSVELWARIFLKNEPLEKLSEDLIKSVE